MECPRRDDRCLGPGLWKGPRQPAGRRMTSDTRFLVPPGGPYLLAHSVGCQPVAARNALERHMLEPWAAKGGEAWPDWLAAIDDFRAALARLLGGAAADYCPQPNLSAGLFALLSAL